MRPRVTRPADTDAEAERVQIELLRAATPAQRAALAIGLTATTVELSRRALQRAQPSASEDDVALRFVELNYGPEIAAALAAWRRDSAR
jgi:hypothetical protein